MGTGMQRETIAADEAGQVVNSARMAELTATSRAAVRRRGQPGTPGQRSPTPSPGPERSAGQPNSPDTDLPLSAGLGPLLRYHMIRQNVLLICLSEIAGCQARCSCLRGHIDSNAVSRRCAGRPQVR
jgi:hypothetical protein